MIEPRLAIRRTAFLLAASATIAAHAAAAQIAPAAKVAGDTKATAQAPITAVGDDYRLGAGDKLRVEVYKDPQLSQSVQIRPDGKITLPLIGDLDAVGKTPIELRDVIATSLKEYINNPTVTVIVVEAIASRVFVMGEVANAGPVPVHGPVTILQVLAMAGGFKEFANTKDVKVLRPTAKGVETLHFNYKQAIENGATPMMVRAGDTIIVK